MYDMNFFIKYKDEIMLFGNLQNEINHDNVGLTLCDAFI